MSDQQTARANDTALALGILALGIVGAAIGYVPWLLAGLVLAAVVVLIAGVAGARPGWLARRSFGVFILMLIPAGLQAYVYYPAFLDAWNPHHVILPLNHAWHPSTLQHYPALLASLTIAAAALISSVILAYWHIQQRRTAGPVHWAKIGDHSGQRPLSRGRQW